jgi:hypothetical protein
MNEQFSLSNGYQQRLESAQQMVNYDDLSDESKALVAQLAYDTDLSKLDFKRRVGCL